MGPFTSWVAEWRKNRELPMPPELAERLAEEVFNSVVMQLQAAITPRFGIPEAHDLVSDQYLALLSCFKDPTRSLTRRVKDTRTLAYWLYGEGWSRFWRSLQKRSIERGPSAFGDPSGAGMESIEDCRSELDAQDIQTKDIIEQSFADMDRLGIPNARVIFEGVILNERTQQQVAEDLKVVHTTIGRWLEGCKFCFAKNCGWSKKQLDAEFGANEVRVWMRDLEADRKHGRK